MGYYYKNNYETVLNVNNDEINENFYLCNGEIVEIINNESIIFDFRKFIQQSDIFFITLEDDTHIDLENKIDSFILENYFINVEDCIYKIVIDFKDGSTGILQRPIKKDDNSWMIIEHLFNFQNDIINDAIIDIHLYNLYGFETHLKLRFKVKQLSLQNQGIELGLVSANMDNEKRVSYIFNDLNENQLLLARRDTIK